MKNIQKPILKKEYQADRSSIEAQRKYLGLPPKKGRGRPKKETQESVKSFEKTPPTSAPAPRKNNEFQIKKINAFFQAVQNARNEKELKDIFAAEMGGVSGSIRTKNRKKIGLSFTNKKGATYTLLFQDLPSPLNDWVMIRKQLQHNSENSQTAFKSKDTEIQETIKSFEKGERNISDFIEYQNKNQTKEVKEYKKPEVKYKDLVKQVEELRKERDKEVDSISKLLSLHQSINDDIQKMSQKYGLSGFEAVKEVETETLVETHFEPETEIESYEESLNQAIKRIENDHYKYDR